MGRAASFARCSTTWASAIHRRARRVHGQRRCCLPSSTSSRPSTRGRSRRTTTSSSSRLLRFPRRHRRSVRRARLFLCSAWPAESHDQIDHDDDVAGERREAERRRVSYNFPDLERDQCPRRDHREIFGPPPLTPEADTFCREERRIKEGDYTQRADLGPAESRDETDHAPGDLLSRRERHGRSPLARLVGETLLHEPQRAERGKEKENRLDELENRDRLHEAIVAVGLTLVVCCRAHPASEVGST